MRKTTVLLLTLAFGPIIQGLNPLQEIGEEIERWRRQQSGEEPEALSDLSDPSYGVAFKDTIS